MWADECGVIMFKAVSLYGDPVELFDGDAEEIIAALQRTLERLRAAERP